jgi:hypothetical protein
MFTPLSLNNACRHLKQHNLPPPIVLNVMLIGVYIPRPARPTHDEIFTHVKPPSTAPMIIQTAYNAMIQVS